jgi:hypothetical protein
MPTPASELRSVAPPEGMIRVPEPAASVGTGRVPDAPDELQPAVMADPESPVAGADSDPSDGDVSGPPEPQAQVATSPPDR